ncbi:MAG: prephenate dehydrogenase/arogenate dehydrogenase family protein [Bacillota bacterium]
MNIGIIGLGLIGGSIGMAVHKKTEHIVFGRDIDENSVRTALHKNAIDFVLNDDDFEKIDVVILAVFPHIACEILTEILPKLSKGTIVCDICGIKGNIISAFEKASVDFPEIKFVGTHPMAGREYSGVDYAVTTLFDSAFGIITPVCGDLESAREIENLLCEIGFIGCVYADSSRHDEMIAYTSQLAHIVSSCYIKNPLSQNHVGFSAGSFQDMTRVARLNPDMWTELFMQNTAPLASHVDLIVEKLSEFSVALKNADEKHIHQLLSEGTSAKEVADENFAAVTSKLLKVTSKN